ncbi:MAG: hypothetical protein GKS02_05515 [Alphaproteobacteria bacterium]|nr:hypothetical protein [Alphaproteobacteria bacterium]
MMKGKLYRRYANGCIYEVIGQAISDGAAPRWTLWNERFAERLAVTETELARQVGWDLVGTTKESTPEDAGDRQMPAALMK